MAEFAGDLQSFKNSFNFLEMDSTIEMMNQFPELNPSFLENPCLNIQSSVGFCNDHSFILSQTQQQQQLQQQQQPQQPQFPINFAGNSLQGIFHLESSNSVPTDHSLASTPDAQHEMKKRKMVSVSDSSSGNSSTPVSETGFGGNDTIKRKNSSGRGKKGRSNSKEVVDKPKEVVHVRARRGQATDSHSLAERVRREKINERLRCLQDLVPGCYKTMGMAVMLDEIISYVQSLQNQVEFLSMKLTAASTFYDFNSDAVDATQIVQGTNAYEAQEMERLVRGDGYGGFSCFHSTLPL